MNEKHSNNRKRRNRQCKFFKGKPGRNNKCDFKRENNRKSDGNFNTRSHRNYDWDREAHNWTSESCYQDNVDDSVNWNCYQYEEVQNTAYFDETLPGFKNSPATETSLAVENEEQEIIKDLPSLDTENEKDSKENTDDITPNNLGKALSTFFKNAEIQAQKMNALKAELEVLRAENVTLRKESEQITRIKNEAVTNLEKKSQTSKKQIQELEDKIETIEKASKVELNKWIQKRAEENEEHGNLFKQKIEELENNLRKTEEILINANAQHFQLEDSLKKKTEEETKTIEKMNSIIQQKEHKITIKKKVIEVLRSTVDSKNNEIMSLEKKLANCQKTNDTTTSTSRTINDLLLFVNSQKAFHKNSIAKFDECIAKLADTKDSSDFVNFDSRQVPKSVLDTLLRKHGNNPSKWFAKVAEAIFGRRYCLSHNVLGTQNKKRINSNVLKALQVYALKILGDRYDSHQLLRTMSRWRTNHWEKAEKEGKPDPVPYISDSEEEVSTGAQITSLEMDIEIE